MEYQIRLATREDAPPIRSIYAPFVESTQIPFEVDPPTTTEMTERGETTLRKYPWSVCETDEGEILGYATASSVQ
jgi:L-amino acid N-acyltransferase YncA